MKRYFRLVLILIVLLLIIGFLLVNFGGGGGGLGPAPSSGQSQVPSQPQSQTFEPKAPIEPIDSIKIPENQSENNSEIKEVRVTKKSGEIVVLINGKAEKNWKETLKNLYAQTPNAFYLSSSGNVSFNELQAVKDFLLSQGIDFVD